MATSALAGSCPDALVKPDQNGLKLETDRPIPRVSKELEDPMAAATPESTDASATPTGRPGLVKVLVAATAVLAAAVSAYVFDPGVVTAAPVVFGLLVTSFLVLDVVRIDLFERAHISRASVPALALACVFGPFGPLAAET